jgi:O-antigen ligase
MKRKIKGGLISNRKIKKISDSKILQGEYLLITLAVASFFITSSLVSSSVGYFLTIILIGFIGLRHLVSHGMVQMPRLPLQIYLLLMILMSISSLYAPSFINMVRLAAFLVSSFTIFVICKNIDFRIFWAWFGSISAVLVVIGLPTLIIDEYSVSLLTIESWGENTLLLPGLNTIQSIFANPNSLGIICAFSIVGNVATGRRSVASLVIIAINIVGLAASDGQAAQLGVVTGVGILILSKRSQTLSVLTTVACLIGILVGTGMVFRLIPGTEFVSSISLNGRRELWTASAQAFSEQPIIGYGTANMSEVLEPYITDQRYLGIGPHNSYIRMILIGGILTGVLYALLHVVLLIRNVQVGTDGALASHAVLWSSVVIQFFNGATVFGLSPSSVLFAIALGWSLQEYAQ